MPNQGPGGGGGGGPREKPGLVKGGALAKSLLPKPGGPSFGQKGPKNLSGKFSTPGPFVSKKKNFPPPKWAKWAWGGICTFWGPQKTKMAVRGHGGRPGGGKARFKKATDGFGPSEPGGNFLRSFGGGRGGAPETPPGFQFSRGFQYPRGGEKNAGDQRVFRPSFVRFGQKPHPSGVLFFGGLVVPGAVFRRGKRPWTIGPRGEGGGAIFCGLFFGGGGRGAKVGGPTQVRPQGAGGGGGGEPGVLGGRGGFLGWGRGWAG